MDRTLTPPRTEVAPLRVRRTPAPLQPETHASYEELLAATDDPAFVQGALAVDFRRDTRAAVAAIHETYDDFASRVTPTSELPDPREWGGRIAQAIAEVVAGIRSPAQVVRWTTPEVHAQVTRVASLTAGRDRLRRGPARRTVLRSVRSDIPRDGVAEVAAVLDDGRRARAVALQLTGFDGRWRVTAWRML